ncbi:MAG: YitT family protein [Bacteroidales bacterium]|jgi:uncharacterized membrane-anchored protein YitT (DUF2179 family)|nr:YitT family protein [Bacteroidales bacterium]
MDSNKERFKIQTGVIDYLVIAFGMTLYVLSWALFLIPSQITGGGISGVSVLLFYGMKIPVGITYFAINSVLVVIAVKKLGASFGIKTLFSMGLATALFSVTTGIVKEPLIDDTFLAAILGGIMGGAGIGIIFLRGGSTGGTDIIAMIITKYRNISPGRIILSCDVIIIASSWFVLHSIPKLVYSYVTMWVVSYSIDAFLSGSNASAQIFIFSKSYGEIADFINHGLGRGATVLDGKGWYTKEDVKVVMTVVRKRETGMIFRKIKELDPDAFISMGSVMGVYGKGFENIKI